MKFLVDAGNSRIKFIYQNDHEFSGYGVDDYDKPDLSGTLDRLWKNLPVPDEIWIANVAGREVADQLGQWIEQHWNKKPYFALVEKQAFGVTNAYADTSKLGIDRWLALLATWNKYTSPAVIVGCGTAVTIDVIDNCGKHLGGLIVPGISLMQEALHMKTSAIPYIKDIKTRSGLADNTEDAVVTGCTLAVVALIEHVLHDLQRQYSGHMKYLMTGGASEYIMKLVTQEFVYEPYLVLEGLALIAGRNP